MHTVKFLHDGIVADATAGENLADVTDRSGAMIPFSCRDGTCGTCLIQVKRGAANLGPVNDKESTTIAIYGGEEGKHRLACQCTVHGDVDIDLP